MKSMTNAQAQERAAKKFGKGTSRYNDYMTGWQHNPRHGVTDKRRPTGRLGISIPRLPGRYSLVSGASRFVQRMVELLAAKAI